MKGTEYGKENQNQAFLGNTTKSTEEEAKEEMVGVISSHHFMAKQNRETGLEGPEGGEYNISKG